MHSFSSQRGADSRNSGGRRYPIDVTRIFFRCLFDSPRRNCGIAAMVRIIVAKVRRVRAFLNWDNEMIRFRSEANLGPISKVGRGAKRGVRRTSLNPGYDLGSPLNSE